MVGIKGVPATKDAHLRQPKGAQLGQAMYETWALGHGGELQALADSGHPYVT